MPENGERIITVAIYTHPELYPPVLNAIDQLATEFGIVQVISRNLLTSQWKYPDNVQQVSSGKKTGIRDSERASTWWKMKSFILYTRTLYKSMKRQKSDWIMCNDPISLWSFRLISPFLGYNISLWYQNHDVVELKSMRKYSVGYYAVKSQRNYFNRIDLFTLPSEQRLAFFPMADFKGKWLVVPNYPSLRRMSKSSAVGWEPGENMKLIYQGRVSNEHGLEEIIDFMKTDPSLELTIVGPGNDEYIHSLKEEIARLGIAERITILDPVPYGELQKITLQHHVGLAVNKPVNILYATAAMASNKMYEYAAAGLPILYFKDGHYTMFLGKYRWAFPTDLCLKGLSDIFHEIRVNYHDLSLAARTEFKNSLNFEVAFHPVLSYISA